MDTTAGLRMLRALPVDADRDGIADALAAACLEFDDVERVQVVFLPEDGSTPFPSSVMSSLLETRMPVAIAGGDGSRPAQGLLVPLLIGENLLGVLKIECSTVSAFETDLTNAFEHLASYAALRIEKATVDSELRQSQERARLAEWELRLSWDTLPAHAWHTSPDGRLEDVNRQWLSYFGLTKEESMDFGYMRVFHPEDRERVRELWTGLLTNEVAGGVEARMVRRDGASRTFLLRAVPIRDESGKVIKWYGLNTDVEDLKIAQSRIQESEQRYAATLSSIGDAVISTDDQGRLTFINPVGEKLTGWTQQEAADRPVEDVFKLIDETHQLVVDPVAEILGREADLTIGNQYTLRSKSGPEVVIDVSGAPIIDSSGEMKGAVLVFRDMTQRNETSDALRKSKEDLARMSRLTAIGELAVSIAHEMNQPLMAIVTNAAASISWLKAGSPNIEEAMQAIDWVLRDGHRAGEVLGGVLALARNSRPKVEPLSIHSVIEEVLLLTKSELRQKGVLVETTYDATADAVNGDRIQLQQVLINLLMNGADAMGTIESERKVLHVVTSRSNGSIEVSVTDNGVGLDPDTADRAFEAFFTTKATGIGMGLSICRSIIEAHGGHIWVTTEKGTGSTFSFTLPPP
ncbi:PAS domain S-box protein [Rhizobium ruizarguesonis]|uniref:PAS domain S-box protein n=1 Tax=Rhizobium ruizarguesonis TaxID=2081791 RepID=UPI0010322D0C|nr:PAS domain S-box protein [Rhizobium ruizarguesonis]MBY5887256.1 PAS domain S-box protein [Rhizobium leguminosarum]TBY56960.1 PAS domain S-box protein [Rhizobium leguminosarum bv. viciae]QSZ04643.1 PAS domain S-box protein [Rhizobium ruizarguesonis]TAZ87650.1 PAS domain S-box protein [Rhizobium ruizarguesonis]TBA09292.1 PAS domain S-box protein [Rhizobium ruizarguesonis]